MRSIFSTLRWLFLTRIGADEWFFSGVQHLVTDKVFAPEELLAALLARVVALVGVHLDVALQVAARHVRSVTHGMVALVRSFSRVRSNSKNDITIT